MTLATCYCSYNFTCGVCLRDAPLIAPVVFNSPVISKQPGVTGMNVERAKAIISTLANGVSPLTGKVLPFDHLLHSPDVARALSLAAGARLAPASASVVITGDPAGGFSFIGPFTADEANEYVDHTKLNDPWWIVELETP